MDPTAQENNDQDQQNPQATQSPIQPGQFVVAQEENIGAPPQVQNPLPQQDPNIFASQKQNSNSQQPMANNPYQPQASPPTAFTANSYQDNTSQAQGPAMPPSLGQQPDPTPFTPPPAPSSPSAAGDSKFGKVKIIGIAAGIISLIIIIAALVWFFVLNKQPTQPATDITNQVIDEPSPLHQPSGSFSQIPESSGQASPAQSPSPAPGQTTGTTPTKPPSQ